MDEIDRRLFLLGTGALLGGVGLTAPAQAQVTDCQPARDLDPGSACNIGSGAMSLQSLGCAEEAGLE